MDTPNARCLILGSASAQEPALWPMDHHNPGKFGHKPNPLVRCTITSQAHPKSRALTWWQMGTEQPHLTLHPHV